MKDETIVHFQKQLDKLDPAKKRVVFMGWPDTVSAENRLEIIAKYMKDNVSDFRVVDIGCFLWDYIQIESYQISLGLILFQQKLHKSFTKK